MPSHQDLKNSRNGFFQGPIELVFDPDSDTKSILLAPLVQC